MCRLSLSRRHTGSGRFPVGRWSSKNYNNKLMFLRNVVISAGKANHIFVAELAMYYIQKDNTGRPLGNRSGGAVVRRTLTIGMINKHGWVGVGRGSLGLDKLRIRLVCLANIPASSISVYPVHIKLCLHRKHAYIRPVAEMQTVYRNTR